MGAVVTEFAEQREWQPSTRPDIHAARQQSKMRLAARSQERFHDQLVEFHRQDQVNVAQLYRAIFTMVT
jgi:hypothetical protein